MASVDDRLTRLEEAILAVANLRDPAHREYPISGGDERSRVLDEAENALWFIAQEIRAERHLR
jgi:hypothetical protein